MTSIFCSSIVARSRRSQSSPNPAGKLTHSPLLVLEFVGRPSKFSSRINLRKHAPGSPPESMPAAMDKSRDEDAAELRPRKRWVEPVTALWGGLGTGGQAWCSYA